MEYEVFYKLLSKNSKKIKKHAIKLNKNGESSIEFDILNKLIGMIDDGLKEYSDDILPDDFRVRGLEIVEVHIEGCKSILQRLGIKVKLKDTNW